MNNPDPLLDRPAIERTFRLLGDRLVRRGLKGDVYVIGGAAMASVYVTFGGDRRAPAVFEHPGLRVYS